MSSFSNNLHNPFLFKTFVLRKLFIMIAIKLYTYDIRLSE